jgi:ParB/RepB/Spo0J family partition protein
MSAAQQLAQFQMLDLDHVLECKLNPRRTFDRVKHEELTASVRERGVLEPILVRSLEDNNFFEVAAGARRVRAAKEAGLTHIPAMVRTMTDAELLEVALLENVVRHDISALDEGDAYRTLVKEHGYTVEQLVEKTGKSRTVVFARMKLAELQGDARKLLTEGKLSASVAELIARLPTPKAQDEAVKALLKDVNYKFKDGDDMGSLALVPFREAKLILDDAFNLVLKKAPFDVKAEMKAAAACTTCPKRTGATPELFDVKDDHCLDVVCWNKKKSESFAQLKATLAEDGKTLVKEKALFAYDGQTLAGAAKTKYSKPNEKVDGKATWKELLGAEVPTVVVLDDSNKTHKLVDKKAAMALLEEKDPKAAAKLKEAPVDSWQVEREKQAKERLVRELVSAGVRQKTLAEVKDLETALELLFASWGAESWDWERRLKLAGLPSKAKLAGLKAPQRVQLLVSEALSAVRNEAVFAQAAKLVKLDLKALKKKATEAEKGKCFVCEATKEKWADDETQVLCVKCAGGED